MPPEEERRRGPRELLKALRPPRGALVGGGGGLVGDDGGIDGEPLVRPGELSLEGFENAGLDDDGHVGVKACSMIFVEAEGGDFVEGACGVEAGEGEGVGAGEGGVGIGWRRCGGFRRIGQ